MLSLPGHNFFCCCGGFSQVDGGGGGARLLTCLSTAAATIVKCPCTQRVNIIIVQIPTKFTVELWLYLELSWVEFCEVGMNNGRVHKCDPNPIPSHIHYCCVLCPLTACTLYTRWTHKMRRTTKPELRLCVHRGWIWAWGSNSSTLLNICIVWILKIEWNRTKAEANAQQAMERVRNVF